MSCLPPPKELADAKSVAQLAEPLRSRVAQLIADAPTGGLVLVSGKRTDYQQWLLRHERCPGRECDRGCKGVPTTAVPGGSNHRNLSASVAAADLGGRELNWANRVKRSYGLHTPVRGEPWHFEPAPGVTPTVPIKAFGVDTPPARRILRVGSHGDDVVWLQACLQAISKRWPRVPDPGKADGDFGAKTKTAVAAFEVLHNTRSWVPRKERLEQDGIATVRTQDWITWWAQQAQKA